MDHGPVVRERMSPLEEIFYERPHRVCQKWAHYFPIYERYIGRFRGLAGFKMLEIGISQGGSLDMWRAYFGAEAQLVGVDVDPRCVCYQSANTAVRIGSQEDRAFLRSLVREFGSFDVILDDGGHTMTQQIITFEELYPTVRPGGTYIVEDVHTSYHAPFGGGLRREGTFIEYAKTKIDELNGFHIDPHPQHYTEFSRNTKAIGFYDSMVAFERGPNAPPRGVQAGEGS
jgi:hypothetical protein